MKIFRNFLILSVAFLAFTSINVNAQSSSVKNTRTVEQKVFKEILKLPYYGLFDHISYKVDGDTVTLYGKVANARNKGDAESYVEDVAGVRNVVNNIEILPLSSFDNTIRRQIVREFANRGGLYRYLSAVNPSVRIIVKNGHVELEGYVANRSDANLMNILANGTFGVFDVKNNLIVENGRAG